MFPLVGHCPLVPQQRPWTIVVPVWDPIIPGALFIPADPRPHPLPTAIPFKCKNYWHFLDILTLEILLFKTFKLLLLL
jgi:hypothetical protein